MNCNREKLREYIDKYFTNVSTVFDVGSRDINGNVRDLFAGKKYIGFDIEDGPNVDVVLSASMIPCGAFGLYAADGIICLDMLEHDTDPVSSVFALRGALAPGGLFVVAVPSADFPYHQAPRDYFRFFEDAFTDIFFRDYKILDLCRTKDSSGYHDIMGIAQKPEG